MNAIVMIHTIIMVNTSIWDGGNTNSANIKINITTEKSGKNFVVNPLRKYRHQFVTQLRIIVKPLRPTRTHIFHSEINVVAKILETTTIHVGQFGTTVSII